MHPFPHRYRAAARAGGAGPVTVSADTLPDIATDAPPEFGGPTGHWSPETLLIAAVADCFILSFRAIARASKLEWQGLSVDVEGVLDRVEGVTRFTHLRVAPRLTIAPGTDEALAHRVLERAERICLITNSLNAEREFAATLQVAGAPPAAP